MDASAPAARGTEPRRALPPWRPSGAARLSKHRYPTAKRLAARLDPVEIHPRRQRLQLQPKPVGTCLKRGLHRADGAAHEVVEGDVCDACVRHTDLESQGLARRVRVHRPEGRHERQYLLLTFLAVVVRRISLRYTAQAQTTTRPLGR